MRLLVGLILTALNGPVGTESREVAGFANFDIAPLKDLEPTFVLHTSSCTMWKRFQLQYVKIFKLKKKHS